eukprot:5462689-Pyramimonas_sp.AAC.1
MQSKHLLNRSTTGEFNSPPDYSRTVPTTRQSSRSATGEFNSPPCTPETTRLTASKLGPPPTGRQPQLRRGGHWGTTCLRRSGYPGAKALVDKVSGLLAVDLTRNTEEEEEEEEEEEAPLGQDAEDAAIAPQR